MEKTTLIFASNNPHKIEEILSIIGDQYKIITLKEASIDIDIPEPHATIEANASEKSKTIYRLTQQNCFGDDTGLEVEALNGEPGVKSARYAGQHKSFDDNIDKLLLKLDDHENRNALFKTVISLMWKGEEYLFEGIVKGMIIYERRGAYGFGYDPVFIPEGSYKTFGEMPLEEKNLFNHRKRAIDKLVEFLKQQ